MGQEASTAGAQANAAGTQAQTAARAQMNAAGGRMAAGGARANAAAQAAGAAATDAQSSRRCYSPFESCNPDQHPDAAMGNAAGTQFHTRAVAHNSGSGSGSGFFSNAMATISRLSSSSAWDFTGTWRLTAITGDMDAFMQQLGVSWTSRTYASMRSYGIGSSTQTITQHGNVMEVESSSLGETTRARYEVGAGRQRVEAADGSAVFTDSHWEDSGRTLVVEAFTDQNVELPRLKRSLEGAVLAEGSGGPQMLLIMTMPASPTLFNGSEVTQHFQRTSAPASETATVMPTVA